MKSSINTPQTQPSASSSGPPRLKRAARILVVDDLPYVREPIASALRAEGFEAACAADGQRALAMLPQVSPDLLILDLEMPGVDGLAVLRHLAASGPGTPAVIVLTVRTDRPSIVRARELGVKHFLLKSSFTLEGLLDHVHRALAERTVPSEPLPASDMATEHAVLGTKPAQPPAAPGARVSDEPPRDIAAYQPLCSAAELKRRLKAGAELRALSPAVGEVLTLCRDPRRGSDEMAAAIKRDQSLALKVLRLANSSAYSCGRKLDSIDQAVVRIGLDAIRQMMVSIGVIDHFNAAPSAIDMLQFWEHSIACGIIASELEEALGGASSQTAFTMGFLHDIGRVVMCEQLGPDYQRVMQVAADTGTPLEVVETSLLGADHAEVAADVLRAWNVPQNLADPIVNHHLWRLGDAPRPRRLTRDAALLGLADAMAHALFLGSSGNATLYPSHHLCAYLGVSGAVFTRVLSSAKGRTQDMKLALLTNCNPSSIEIGSTSRKDPRQAFKPLYENLGSDVDALSSALTGLADPTLVEPNVGVIHVAHAAEAPRAAAAYLESERRAQTGPLPVLCLSVSGVVLDLGPRRWQKALKVPLCEPELRAALASALVMASVPLAA